MHVRKKVAAVILILAITTPALAARRDDGSGVYDRLARFVSRIIRSIVSNGDGMIPPIPDPPRP
ncbi:MAG TPA: hypothetical protein VK648_05680 [Gemmatimonadaceae bacterium]|nr:MAG: hypothetical protein DMF56_20690 [Acidobacteriota bacterium]HTD83266.1 hypothetical protein [Gemmatimonadaceae bacterium]